MQTLQGTYCKTSQAYCHQQKFQENPYILLSALCFEMPTHGIFQELMRFKYKDNKAKQQQTITTRYKHAIYIVNRLSGILLRHIQAVIRRFWMRICHSRIRISRDLDQVCTKIYNHINSFLDFPTQITYNQRKRGYL